MAGCTTVAARDRYPCLPPVPQDIKQHYRSKLQITPATRAAFRRLLAEIEASARSSRQKVLADVRRATGGVEVEVDVWDCIEMGCHKETVLITPDGDLIR